MSGRMLVNLQFYVTAPTEAKIVPEVRNIVNNFDNMGALVSLPRLDGERNVDYRNRVWDVSVHPSDPTYAGVVNGIGRELGILRNHAMTIDLKLDSAGEPIATSPRVDILAHKVVLYSDWRPDETEVVDKEIRFYTPDDDGYFLEDLITEINSSTCFSAVMITDTRANIKSTNLLRGTTDLVLRNDLVRSANMTELSFGHIIRDSVTFDEYEIFATEVTGDPAAEGEYRLDYTNGIIYVYSRPSGTGSVDYHFGIFPYKVDTTPIEIYTLQDDDFKSELFEQHTLDSGDTIDGLINDEGAEIYHTLFEGVDVFWGE